MEVSQRTTHAATRRLAGWRGLCPVVAWALCLVACLASVSPACATGTEALPVALPPPRLPTSGWLTLESPHFLVHFPPGEEQFARRVAWAAEEAHRYLVPRLQYLPEEKTHVVLADVSDVSNAYTRVTPYNHIVVYPVFPDNLAYDSGISPRTTDWFEQLLRHEYAHVLHQEMHAGSATQVRRLFGRVPWLSTPNAMQSYAVIEGYATYEETGLQGGRGGDSLYDMFLRAAVLEDRLPSWSQVLGHYNLQGWWPGPPPYLYGYSFVDYIARTYGEGQIAKVHWQHAEQPWLGPSAAFGKVLGVPFSQLWEDWRAAMITHYREQEREIQPSTVVNSVPPVGDVALWPRWSPDGGSIVYGSSGGVVPALRWREVVGNAPGTLKGDRPLVNGLVDRSNGYAWAPDGKSVIYGKLEYEGGRLTSDLYAYDLGRRREKRLTRGFRAYSPALSPDGEWLAFLSRREDVSRILVTSLERMLPLVLWTPSAGELAGADEPLQVLSLAWSPKGGHIAFTARDRSGQVDLFLLPVTLQRGPGRSGPPVRVTSDEAVEMDPSWSPDGRLLLFASDLGGVYNIHAWDIQEGQLCQVTRVLYGAFAPSVSPDGAVLLYTSYSSQGYSLATMPLNPSEWARYAPPQLPRPGAGLKAEEPVVDRTIRLADVPERVINVPQPGYDGSGSILTEDRAAWRRDVARAVDPRDFIIRRYAATETLTPRYWLPVWGGSGGGWVSGGSTSAEDAQGRHAYHFAISLGGAVASYRLGYEYRPNPLHPSPVYGISLTGARESHVYVAGDATDLHGAAGGARAHEVGDTGEAYAAWYWPGTLGAKRAFMHLEQATGTLATRSVGAGVQWWRQGGNGPLRRNVHLGLYASTASVTAEWAADVGRPGEYRLSLSGNAAAAGAKDRFVLPIRGLPEGSLRGRFAGYASLEAEFLLKQVQAGWGDQPVFIHNLSWSAFTDVGAAANTTAALTVVKATVGAELRVTGTLGYGLSRGDVRVGIARPWDGASPWSVYVGLGAGF